MLELIKGDTRTITGKNIREVLKYTDGDDILNINAKDIMKTIKFKEIPPNEKWRIPLIKELTNVKQHRLEVRFDNGEYLSEDDIDKMLSFASIS